MDLLNRNNFSKRKKRISSLTELLPKTRDFSLRETNAHIIVKQKTYFLIIFSWHKENDERIKKGSNEKKVEIENQCVAKWR